MISSKHIASDLPGFKKNRIDSSLLNNYYHLSLSETLAGCTPLFVKSYGYGGASTASFRGTAATHTRITWNGIDINSPMPGQTDFSLFASGMSDIVQVAYGGASLSYGSGGFGGTINLEHKPDWNNNTDLTVRSGAGSFGRYSGSLKFKSGTAVLQTVTRLMVSTSENDFTYLNDVTGQDPVWEKRRNSQMDHKEFMEEFYYKKDSGIFNALLWYQSTSRNLPGSMLTSNLVPDEKQYDDAFRSIVGYDFQKNKINISLKGSWLSTRLHYTSKTASINSENYSNTLVLKGGAETSIRESIKLNMFITNEVNIIESNNYSKDISRNAATLSISAQIKRGNRFGSTLLYQQILDGRSLLLPDFSVGLEYRIITGEEHYLKGNISRNSRIPSLNDLYWSPGGNSSLKNEYAREYEIGYNFSQNLSARLLLDAEITGFYNHIRDMIQWLPGEYSYWSAKNVGSVNASGLESYFSLKYNYLKLDIKLNAAYSYTKSVSTGSDDNINGKQLLYIPENQVNSSLNIAHGKIYIFWNTDFTGRRFITVDNAGYLPGYTINTLINGIKIELKRTTFDLNFKIENIFNTIYQTIAYHPQPGRSYFLSLSFHLTK